MRSAGLPRPYSAFRTPHSAFEVRREAVDGAIRSVAMVGVGIMGSGIAAEYAAAGRAVTLLARDEGRAAQGRERVGAALRTLEGGGVLPAGAAEEALARVRAVTELQAAVEGADLVVESIPEDLALKRDLF